VINRGVVSVLCAKTVMQQILDIIPYVYLGIYLQAVDGISRDKVVKPSWTRNVIVPCR
jgi:hypothetical protein